MAKVHHGTSLRQIHGEVADRKLIGRWFRIFKSSVHFFEVSSSAMASGHAHLRKVFVDYFERDVRSMYHCNLMALSL